MNEVLDSSKIGSVTEFIKKIQKKTQKSMFLR